MATFTSGLQPIILLNKVDTIDPELIEHPELVYASDKVEEYIKQLVMKKFPRGLIFPITTYFEPPFNNELDPVKDYLLLSALHTLLFNNMKPKLAHVIQVNPPQQQPQPAYQPQLQQVQLQQPQQQLQQAYHQLPLPSQLPQLQQEQRQQPQQDLPQQLQQLQLDQPQNPQQDQLQQPLQATLAASNNNVKFIVNVRRLGTIDDAFKKCRLPMKDFATLKSAIRATFSLSCDPLHIYEIQNGNKISIENDDDVDDVQSNATIEFTA